MNGAQLHLLVNHTAVIGVPVAFAFLAWGLLRRQDAVARAGMGFLALTAASVALAYFTGEGAEHVAEDWGVSHDVIHDHEEWAEWAAVASGALAALAVGILLAWRRAVRPALGWLTLAAALPVMGVLGWTAHLGGEIRHPEIRTGADAVYPDEARGDDHGGDPEEEYED